MGTMATTAPAQDEQLAAVLADPALLRAEFDAIIATSWPTAAEPPDPPTPPAPPAGAVGLFGPNRTHRTGTGTGTGTTREATQDAWGRARSDRGGASALSSTLGAWPCESPRTLSRHPFPRRSRTGPPSARAAPPPHGAAGTTATRSHHQARAGDTYGRAVSTHTEPVPFEVYEEGVISRHQGRPGGRRAARGGAGSRTSRGDGR